MMKLYADEILDGRKTNDTRLYPTGKRGRIAIVDSTTYRVYGVADLISVREIPYEEFVKWHQTGPFENTPIAPYCEGRTCYSYELENVKRLPIPYQLPKDLEGRMWIDIPGKYSRNFFSQTKLF